ncbi:MAG: hypothetical protein J7J29_01095 [Psychrobacter sp.]|jgi:uncharacterized protein (DUF697 family)|uniref:DUF697 domain-containing protein n=1 Tax=Psychrobacter namhaensis TaxID=292734 RepID=A0ABW8L4D3_9GAMM|nr:MULTISPECIES: hypothetical protein [Psychrobacter]MCD1278479.1 hypothetical protein [Psychrobacter sp. CCUG 69069]MCD6250894.1 hypothetical protein [Psychrobacter sp.]HCN18217.1 hypothetical protein [Psychrobacter sp.]|tara:strand:+ start:1262 stop:1777 length:516 start_codon:yes stop_codon:yes gene_type:complete
MKTTPLAEKLPDTIDPNLDLDKVKKECQKLVKKRARVSAGVAIVPVPFFDVAVDAGMLTQLVPEISERFGLIEDRKSAIDLQSKEVHWRAVKDRTVDFAGLMATRGLVKKTIQTFGGRIAAKQVTKFVPLGGQLVAATMGYTIFKKIANDHINDCYKLAKDIQKKQHGKNV